MASVIEGDVFWPKLPAPPAKTQESIPRYSWNTFADGQVWLLWAGTDYFVSTASLRSALSQWAARNEISARTKGWRVIDQAGEARECLAIHLKPAADVKLLTFDHETGLKILALMDAAQAAIPAEAITADWSDDE